MNKHLITLEFDKVLKMLSERCASFEAVENALNLVPEKTYEAAKSTLLNTTDAYLLTAKFGSPSFGGLKNVNNALARASAGGVLNMSELLDIAGVLRAIRALLEWRDHSAGQNTSLDGLFSALYSNRRLEEHITSCILSPDEMSDNASSSLYSIRRKIQSASNKIRDRLDGVLRSSSTQKFLQDTVITQRNGRYVVPVKSEFRSEIAGLVHGLSSTGSTVFVEPMAVVEANNEIALLKSKEQEEIERILAELSSEAAEHKESIMMSCDAAFKLDLIFAKASLAFDMKASEPVLCESGVTNLKKARHPLLDKNTVVPIDIRIGGEFDTLVITGPNTGGKTVSIKTLGLITLMAQSGMFIPCEDNSTVVVYENILADIGDEQSIEQSLSTFSSHIKNIIGIIEAANDSTLVLLDELCSGTDPVEGAALAISILEHLRSVGAAIAATTHYAELKAYALDTKGVNNASCEFDIKTLSPSYRLIIGTPGRSNAFAICNRLGLNTEVIENAEGLVSQEDKKFERVVSQLEAARKELEDKYQEADEATAKAKRLEREAAEMQSKLKANYDREIENARAAARVIADNARAEVNRILDELEAIKKSKNKDLAAARQAANAGFKSLDKIATDGEKFDDGYTLPRPLQLGDKVILKDTGSHAEVIALPDSKGIVRVQCGSMKMKVNKSNLRLADNKQEKKKPQIGSYREKGVQSGRAALEIDLRGMNVEEAIMDLDRFIDNAILSGVNSVTVIHGKGTGVLRAGVQQHLKKHKCVRTFRLGVFGEGEAGVTIVELK